MGILVPADLGGEGATHLRCRRHLLHARPRLRLDRDDLRDASDQGRDPGAARRRQRLARAAAAPAVRRTDAARLLDHRRHGGGNMRASACAVERDGAGMSLERNATVDFLWRGGRRHRDHGPPRARAPRLRPGAGGARSRTTTRWSGVDGTRSACAAPAAPASR